MVRTPTVTRLTPSIRPVAVVVAHCVILALVTVLWLSRDASLTCPPDSANHLIWAQSHTQIIKAGGLAGLWQNLREVDPVWSPGTYLVLGLAGQLVGDGHRAMRGLSLLFIPLLAWAVYRVGKRLTRDPWLAALATSVTLLSIGIVGQTRQVGLDLPGAAMALVGLGLLLDPGVFIRARPSLMFGAAVGLTVLFRGQSLFFLFGPSVLVATRALLQARGWRRRTSRAGWMVAALATAALVASPWWIGRLELVWGNVTSHLNPDEVRSYGDPSFWGGLAFYFGVAGRLAGWPMLFGALGAAVLLVRRQNAFRALIPLTWVGCGILGWTATVSRSEQYLLAAIPGLALLACAGLGQLSGRPRRVAIVALYLVTVGPTLVLALLPPAVHARLKPLGNRGVLYMCYTRGPSIDPQLDRAVGEISRTLREAEPPSTTNPGGASYLVFAFHEGAKSNISPAASLIVSRLPGLLFSFNWPGLGGRSVHRRERERRRVWFLADAQHPELKPASHWNVRLVSGKYQRLYLHPVPRTHPIARRGATLPHQGFVFN
jgi:hypothetical protein